MPNEQELKKIHPLEPKLYIDPSLVISSDRWLFTNFTKVNIASNKLFLLEV